jgi:hypothetical protein
MMGRHRTIPVGVWARITVIGIVVFGILVPVLVHVLRLDTPRDLRSQPPAKAQSGGQGGQPAEPTGRTFYLSATGDDTGDGLTPATAWRSIGQANTAVFTPGDRLLLQGGTTFRGALRLGQREAGQASAPVVVGSYGSGRATISASGASAITVYDTGGVEIQNLDMVGDRAAFTEFEGIKLFSDLPDDRKLDHVVISQVDVTGFAMGIGIGGGRGATGFRDVRVSDSKLHGNRDAGLISTGPAFNRSSPTYANEAITISNVQAYDNLGNPDERQRSTGNGIVLGSVNGGLIEGCTAHDNGAKNNSFAGPVGIWAYDSTDVKIQHDVAYHNRRAGHADGGGFDLDQNVSSSVIQYNYSYDNDGPGYLLYSRLASEARTGNIVRYNISNNDARKGSPYGAFTLSGNVKEAQIYHNTVVVGPSGSEQPPALRLHGTLVGVTIRNNIFVSRGTELLDAGARYSINQVLLQGNDLYRTSGGPLIRWKSTPYHSLAAWRRATGQERLGTQPTGLSVDPKFGHLTGAAAFKLSATSPLIGHALDLFSLFGIDPGGADYFGTPMTGKSAVGAVEPAT